MSKQDLKVGDKIIIHKPFSKYHGRQGIMRGYVAAKCRILLDEEFLLFSDVEVSKIDEPEEFKVGDHVRINLPDSENHEHLGEIIADQSWRGYPAYTVYVFEQGLTSLFDASDLIKEKDEGEKKMPDLKVGDRVRIANSINPRLNGEIGRIETVPGQKYLEHYSVHLVGFGQTTIFARKELVKSEDGTAEAYKDCVAEIKSICKPADSSHDGVSVTFYGSAIFQVKTDSGATLSIGTDGYEPETASLILGDRSFSLTQADIERLIRSLNGVLDIMQENAK